MYFIVHVALVHIKLIIMIYKNVSWNNLISRQRN